MNNSIEVIPILNDNYVFLLLDHQRKTSVVIDPGEAKPVIQRLTSIGYSLEAILNTHHHWDHVDGNLELKEWAQCPVYASKYDSLLQRIPGCNRPLSEGDQICFGEFAGRIIEVPGHTLGHIAYFFDQENILFIGDTLFSMGCGRLFEGAPTQMHSSLLKVAALSQKTSIYCTHEYTLSNGKFALSVEPNNVDLQNRMKEVLKIRERGEPTVPTRLEVELKTNPFLRTQSLEIRSSLNLPKATEIEVFAELRSQKDRF